MYQQVSMMDMLQEAEIEVRPIRYEDARPYLMEIHYARRMPCITYAFGLFERGELVGVCTYGMPASPNLCEGLAGEENASRVLELNRLVILPGRGEGKNYASYLVSHSLRMLPSGTFVVSYADTAWSHVGYVYQACNFLYTGMSAKRTDTYQPTGKHSRHAEQLDLNDRQTRSPKHRYVYLVGDRRTKKLMRRQLRYAVVDRYPKGDETRYDPKNPVMVNPIEHYVKE